jgi:hypothetical protein
MVFNLAEAGEDQDGNMPYPEGTITDAQGAELKKLLTDKNIDHQAFFGWVSEAAKLPIDRLGAIPQYLFQRCVDRLQKTRRKAANWDVAAPVAVLPRALVDFPDQPLAGPASHTDLLLTIPWQATFDWVPVAGRNLMIEVVVYGNSFGSIYGYPIDNLSGTVSIWGTPQNATIANGGPVRTFGLVMGFVEQTQAAVPALYSTDTPQIGNTFRVRVAQTVPSSAALLFLGWSSTSWNGAGLPLSLGGIGAPGCNLLVSADDARPLTTNGAGAGSYQYVLPNVIYALGLSFYNQAFVFDPTANALGFVATNGGVGVFGNQ